MEIKINIEKKYMWMILFTIVAVGFVVAYGGTNPQEVGHSYDEIEGVPKNCDYILKQPAGSTGQAECNLAKNNGQWGMKGPSAWAALAYDAVNLGGFPADFYCKEDGTDCPFNTNAPQIPNGYIYKTIATDYCSNSAFLCLGSTAGSGARSLYTPSWQGNSWKYFSGASWQSCTWVLCDSPAVLP